MNTTQADPNDFFGTDRGGKQLDLPALPSGFQVSNVGIVATGNLYRLGYRDYVDAIHLAIKRREAATWLLYDLITLASERLGDRFHQLVAETGLSQRTVENAISIVKSFPIERRRSMLTVSHHDAVRSLEAADQDVLLDKAEPILDSDGNIVRPRLNREELRDEVRVHKALQQGLPILTNRVHRVGDQFLADTQELLDYVLALPNPPDYLGKASDRLVDALRDLNWIK